MQNSIYKIKYLLFLSWDWEAWCLTQSGGVIHPPERNTAWNKGRKCFHCLGAPNNVIRPWQYLYVWNWRWERATRIRGHSKVWIGRSIGLELATSLLLPNFKFKEVISTSSFNGCCTVLLSGIWKLLWLVDWLLVDFRLFIWEFLNARLDICE